LNKQTLFFSLGELKKVDPSSKSPFPNVSKQDDVGFVINHHFLKKHNQTFFGFQLLESKETNLPDDPSEKKSESNLQKTPR
jgi:hypothetical protein